MMAPTIRMRPPGAIDSASIAIGIFDVLALIANIFSGVDDRINLICLALMPFIVANYLDSIRRFMVWRAVLALAADGYLKIEPAT